MFNKKGIDAEETIKTIIDKGNLVVYRTAMNSLRMFTWYHPDAPYTKIYHSSIILGYDENVYFYIELPQVRNVEYFRENPTNLADGYLKRKYYYKHFRFFVKWVI